jgi:uridine kinase
MGRRTEPTAGRPVLLGVAGGSGSGKTAVARAIVSTIGEGRLASVAQDAYYRDIDWSRARPAEYNFDHPSTIDFELLVEHLRELKAGRAIEAPVYDFVTHRRRAETERIEPRPVVVIDGILLFAEPAVRELLDLRIFVDTDADVRLIRRLRRDTTERGRSIESVLKQYEEQVRPMHLELVEPSRRWADVIVPEGGMNRVAMSMVVAQVEKLLRRSPT